MFQRWFTRNGKGASANGQDRHGHAHLIDMRQIVKTYQSAAGTFTALRSVDLQVNRGEFVAIIGKSGSGKSTLINMLTGIDRPTSGDVLVGDTAVHRLSEGQMAEWRGKNLGIIFQFFQLLPTLSIVENVMLPMDFCNMYAPGERRDRAMHLLSLVEMEGQAHKLPSAVSGGQQQRVAIARALANDPPILVADEPTGNLDSKTANAVFQLFERLVADGKTVLMVTHDSDLAKRVSRAVIVADGEIVNQYVVQALKTLSVEQLGWVARNAERKTFTSGATILTQGELADTFYIVTRGQVEVLLHNPSGRNVLVTTMQAGQYFGEVELLRGSANIANIRAANTSDVEVAMLDRQEFTQLIGESEMTRIVIDQLADARAAENVAARGQEVAHASPRWRKVLSDLTSNKTRTILVVLSIAVGVFAVGMIAGSRAILANDLATANDSTNPFSAMITTSQPFDDQLVQTIRRMPGIADAEARGLVIFQVRVGDQEGQNAQFDIIPNFDDMRISTIRPVAGAWPPPRKALLLERTSLAFLGVAVGDDVTIELPDGTRRTMRVAGTVHDVNWASQLYNFGKAYITRDTARWLGQADGFNQLRLIVAEHADDEAHIKQVVSQVRDKIEKAGLTVDFTQIPSPPGKHWADQIMQALLLIMGVLGIVALILSGFLVINTIGAILTQQVRQIGIMKSIGARRGAIVSMYLAMVCCFGVLSLVVAMPLGALGAHLFVGVFAGLLNFDTGANGIPPSVLALELAAGLVVPLLAALWPVFAGARISVREAITSYGLSQGKRQQAQGKSSGAARFAFSLLPFAFPRPMLLSLRNTFRRRGRLALTLSTLTLAGAMVIAVASVSESLTNTAEDFFTTYSYDVMAFTERPYRVAPMLAAAREVPGVVAAEGWGRTNGRRVLADRTKTENIVLTALPLDTKLFQPQMIAGRWLQPGDENAVVVAADLLKAEKDLKLGDDMILDIGGRESSWRIVGIAQVLFVGRAAYTNYDYTARVTNDVGKSSFVTVVTTQHDAAFQGEVAKAVREQLKRAGFNVSGTQTIGEVRASVQFQFRIIVVMLLVMAILLAVVGGLGLMGTMSINVLERTREIGVMRAIGASNGAILGIVMVEGIIIGIVSWVIGALIALPFSRLLAEAVGQVFLKSSPSYIFSSTGALLWLGTVIVLAAVSSMLPAWNASRVTVRDVLAYE